MSPPPCAFQEHCHDPPPCPLRKSSIYRTAGLELVTPHSIP